MIAFILIFLANENLSHPILLAWSISIFVYEFLSINIIRLLNNQELFEAGHDHLHHILFKLTKSIFKTNFLMFMMNSTLFIMGYFIFELINPLASLLLFIFMFVIFLFLRKKFSKINIVLKKI